VRGSVPPGASPGERARTVRGEVSAPGEPPGRSAARARPEARGGRDYPSSSLPRSHPSPPATTTDPQRARDGNGAFAKRCRRHCRCDSIDGLPIRAQSLHRGKIFTASQRLPHFAGRFGRVFKDDIRRSPFLPAKNIAPRIRRHSQNRDSGRPSNTSKSQVHDLPQHRIVTPVCVQLPAAVMSLKIGICAQPFIKLERPSRRISYV
jgi:hypothetical protein